MSVKLDSSTDILRGELMMFIGNSPIAFSSSAGLDVSVEEIDISNKMTGGWAGSLPGKKSYTLSCESFITRKTGAMSFDTLLEKVKDGTPVEFVFGSALADDQDNFGGTFRVDTTQTSYSGKVIITNLSVKSDNGQIATCSASFKGVGALKTVDGTPG